MAEKWTSCKTPPDSGRNVFIIRGWEGLKIVTIGHYEADGIWYEDRNWFQKPMRDALYWCEIPEIPEMEEDL